MRFNLLTDYRLVTALRWQKVGVGPIVMRRLSMSMVPVAFGVVVVVLLLLVMPMIGSGVVVVLVVLALQVEVPVALVVILVRRCRRMVVVVRVGVLVREGLREGALHHHVVFELLKLFLLVELLLVVGLARFGAGRLLVARPLRQMVPEGRRHLWLRLGQVGVAMMVGGQRRLRLDSRARSV